MSEPWFQVTVQRGYVRLYHARAARDRTEVRQVLDACDAALDESGSGLLLFDSRDAHSTPPEIAAIIWHWLQDHVAVRKVATLMHSRERSRNVRKTGAASGVLLKTFTDEEKARRWLHER